MSDWLKNYDLDILKIAMHNNQRHGITGFMHRNDTHFFQYIEGAAPEMRQLAENLQQDHRHLDFETLKQGEITQRSLPDGRWAIPMDCTERAG